MSDQEKNDSALTGKWRTAVQGKCRKNATDGSSELVLRPGFAPAKLHNLKLHTEYSKQRT